MFRWRKSRPAASSNETLETLVARCPDIRDLLTGLGYDGPAQAAAADLMKELLALVRVEVADFDAFEKALNTAMTKRDGLPAPVSAFLGNLAAAQDRTALLKLLNEDPVHDQVPWIEQLPVLKRGVITWTSPVHHTLIRKRPADRDQFRNKLARMEALFQTPHPARSEQARIAVLDAITRLRREIERDRCYLPTATQFLEAKLSDYSAALKPKAGEWLRGLVALLERLIALRNRMEAAGSADVNALSEQTVHYLATPRLHTPGLTSYILALLLDARATALTRRVSKASSKAMDIIRAEVAGGNYDGEETARRLRQLEAEGFLAPSLVFPLLRLPVGEAARAAAGTAGDRLIALAPRPAGTTRIQSR